jgi:hypothetical protein
MPNNGLAFLICRATALWLVVTTLKDAVAHLATHLMQHADELRQSEFAGFVFHYGGTSIPAAGQLLAGIVLWWQSARLSRVMVSNDERYLFNSNVDARGWLIIAFATVGAMGAFDGISGVAYAILSFLFQADNSPQSVKWILIGILQATIRLLFGIGLVFGSRSLADQLLGWTRESEHPRQD